MRQRNSAAAFLFIVAYLELFDFNIAKINRLPLTLQRYIALSQSLAGLP